MIKFQSCILVINSGSATIKFKIFDFKNLKSVGQGIFEKIGLKDSFLKISGLNKRLIFKKFPKGIKTHQQALELIFENLDGFKNRIKIVGHRVVHGGTEFTKPTIVSKNVLKALARYNELAPLHNPVNLVCLKACQKLLPQLKNVAVFDTAFYNTLPVYTSTYALPLNYLKKFKIRKYGFHGISHQYVSERAAKILKKKNLRMVTCHLGSGVSITATKFGKAIDTSMGFTPLEGLMMGTRCGDLDPAVPLYLQKKLKISPVAAEKILNKKSGILGVFGYSSDVRDILLAAGYKIPGYRPLKKFNQSEIARAKLALAMFIYRIVKYIGSYAAALTGLDAVVFTAGIGERSQIIRNLITKEIKKIFPKVKVLIIPTDEELIIAKECKKLVMKL